MVEDVSSFKMLCSTCVSILHGPLEFSQYPYEHTVALHRDSAM